MISRDFPSFGIRLLLAEGWVDATGNVQTPLTLVRGIDGVGALQFSVAHYTGGRKPDVSLAHLKDLLRDFAEARELTSRGDYEEVQATLMFCRQSYLDNQLFWRVWYASDGANIVLATYNCERGDEKAELNECEAIVQSVEFISQGPAS